MTYWRQHSSSMYSGFRAIVLEVLVVCFVFVQQLHYVAFGSFLVLSVPFGVCLWCAHKSLLRLVVTPSGRGLLFWLVCFPVFVTPGSFILSLMLAELRDFRSVIARWRVCRSCAWNIVGNFLICHGAALSCTLVLSET